MKMKIIKVVCKHCNKEIEIEVSEDIEVGTFFCKSCDKTSLWSIKSGTGLLGNSPTIRDTISSITGNY